MKRRLAILSGCVLAVGTVGLAQQLPTRAASVVDLSGVPIVLPRIADVHNLGDQAASSAADDERAVRDLVARYVDARRRRDAHAVGALFTDDADQLTSGGEWRRGRQQIETGTADSSERNPGTRTIDVEIVRFVAPGVAIADGRYRIDQDGTASRQMWTTFVAVRTSAGWRIAAIRNMRPTSASPA